MNKYPIEFSHAPSPQQQDIYDYALGGEGDLVVQATAGAGKSSTLVTITKLLAATGYPLSDVLFVAFNKAIVNELQEKLPKGVRASTMHAFGMQILKDHLGDVRVEGFKYSNIIRDLLADEGIIARRHKDYREISDSLKDLVNTLRLSLAPFEEMSKEQLLNLLEDTQEEFPKAYAGLICNLACETIRKGIKQADKRGEIDFTDMLYLPWKFDLTPKQQYGLVLSDESQDTNDLQRWLILKARRANGRVFAVGDKFQAIYGFAGASPDSLNLMRNILKADELPLSVTWRCPKSHVELAQAVIGAESIQAAPNAKEGVVGEVSQTQFERQVKEGDVILSRTNRPLIAQAFEFIKAGRRAKIRGRDIGQGLIKTVDSVVKDYCSRNFSPSDFLKGLSDWRSDKEDAIYKRTDLNADQQSQKVAEIADRAEVLSLITENSKAQTLEDLKISIERLFDDSLGDFILLSTIHKAKGLEFKNVYIIDPGNLPARFARGKDDAAGEKCVAFVALTRAKKALYFVGGLPNLPAVQEAFHRIQEREGSQRLLNQAIQTIAQ